jgi:hypothetical protein
MPWGRIVEWMYSSTHSWPRHWMEVSGYLHAPAALSPRRKARYPMYERLCGPHSRSGRAGEEKTSQSLLGIELRYSSLEPSHCPDCTTAAPITLCKFCIHYKHLVSISYCLAGQCFPICVPRLFKYKCISTQAVYVIHSQWSPYIPVWISDSADNFSRHTTW